METHRRSLCRECKREWVEPTFWFVNSSPVTITGNPKSLNNCPICGSPEVEIIEYKPSEPGLDIPRDNIENLKKIPVELVSQIGNTDAHKSYAVKVLGDRDPKDLIVPSLAIEVEGERSSIYDLSDMD